MTSSRSLVMITLNIEVSPGKKQELLQALEELRPIILREKGCQQVNVSQTKPDTEMIIFSENWANGGDALRHICSENFKVLGGATTVLAKTLKMTISIELHTVSVDLKKLGFREEIIFWAEKTLFENKNRKNSISERRIKQ